MKHFISKNLKWNGSVANVWCFSHFGPTNQTYDGTPAWYFSKNPERGIGSPSTREKSIQTLSVEKKPIRNHLFSLVPFLCFTSRAYPIDLIHQRQDINQTKLPLFKHLHPPVYRPAHLQQRLQYPGRCGCQATQSHPRVPFPLSAPPAAPKVQQNKETLLDAWVLFGFPKIEVELSIL